MVLKSLNFIVIYVLISNWFMHFILILYLLYIILDTPDVLKRYNTTNALHSYFIHDINLCNIPVS